MDLGAFMHVATALHAVGEQAVCSSENELKDNVHVETSLHSSKPFHILMGVQARR